jgi:hypothetical protein
MRKILIALLATFLGLPALAGEVLVLTTATRVDPAPLSGRRGIEIQNNGPNTIVCQVRNTTGLTTTKGRLVLPGEAWAVGAYTNTPIYCLALTANQVTGAATNVTEVP